MKVKFLDPGKDFPQSMLTLGYSPNVNLHLIPGVIYIVFGILIWRSVVHYLIIPTDSNLPDWVPADVFTIINSSIPPEWYFHYYGNSDPSEYQIMLSYKEMALDHLHCQNLIERNEDAIRTFFSRKKEIENSQFSK